MESEGLPLLATGIHQFSDRNEAQPLLLPGGKDARKGPKATLGVPDAVVEDDDGSGKPALVSWSVVLMDLSRLYIARPLREETCDHPKILSAKKRLRLGSFFVLRPLSSLAPCPTPSGGIADLVG